MEIITRQVDNLGVERNLFGVPAINLTKTKITNKRQLLLSWFVEEINKSRKGTKFKPLTPEGITRLCMRINSHPLLKSDEELQNFFDQCKCASSFSGKCYSDLPKLN